MIHPHAKQTQPQAERGTDKESGRGFVDYHGKPDVFPPVVVNNTTQEAEHRAKGYIGADEPLPQAGDYQDFPKWMQHETHEAILVNDAAQQAEAEDRGYTLPGKSDPNAVESARAAPYIPGSHPMEYPRMENGVLVEDPDLPGGGPVEYPKALTPPNGGEQVFVKNRAEERATFAKWGIDASPKKNETIPLSDKKTARSEKMKAVWAAKKAAKAAQAQA